jgi:hypothetical protein
VEATRADTADPQVMSLRRTAKMSAAIAIGMGLAVFLSMIPRAIHEGYFTRADILVYMLEPQWGPWEADANQRTKSDTPAAFAPQVRRLEGFTLLIDNWSIWNPRALARTITDWERKNPRTVQDQWRGELLKCPSGRAAPGSWPLMGKQNCESIATMMRLGGFEDERSLVAAILSSTRCRVLRTLKVEFPRGDPRHALDCAGSEVSLVFTSDATEALRQQDQWTTSLAASQMFGLPVMVCMSDIPFGSWFGKGDPLVSMVNDYGVSHLVAALAAALAGFVAVWLVRWRATAGRVAGAVAKQARRADRYLVGTTSESPPSNHD